MRHLSYLIKGSLQCCRCDRIAQVMICLYDTVIPKRARHIETRQRLNRGQVLQIHPRRELILQHMTLYHSIFWFSFS